jgi:hypothetical protein
MPAVRPNRTGSKKLAETTGLEAKTIHRLLEIDPKTGRFSRNEANPLAYATWGVRGGKLVVSSAAAE